MRIRTWLAGGLTALLAACSSPTPAPGPVSTPPAQGRAADVATLLTRLEAVHPAPYHSVPAAAIRAAADDLASRAGTLRDDQFLVEVMRLVAKLGTGGRDGHTGVWPWLNERLLRRLPLRLWEFPDGVYVTGATSAYRDLVGSRITAVEGTPIDRVLAAVEPLVPRDNPTTVLAFRPAYLVCAQVLTGLGLAPNTERITLTVAAPGAAPRAAPIDTVPALNSASLIGGWEWTLPGRPGSLSLGHLDDEYHVEYVAARRAIYFQYNAVHPAGTTLADALHTAMRDHRVDRVVVDVRFNHGGDNTTYGAFVRALAAADIDRPGRVYLLVGRLTFSAAANFAAELVDAAEHVRVIGEPSGGSPNQYGDQAEIRLPYSGIGLTSANTWVEVVPDQGLAVVPDLPVPLSAADYFAGRDPALHKALTGW